MRDGMLWFDNTEPERRSLLVKITRAVDYYTGKYGSTPTICFVHPTMTLNEKAEIAGLEIRTTNSVLPNHFWLGTSDKG